MRRIPAIYILGGCEAPERANVVTDSSTQTHRFSPFFGTACVIFRAETNVPDRHFIFVSVYVRGVG